MAKTKLYTFLYGPPTKHVVKMASLVVTCMPSSNLTIHISLWGPYKARGQNGVSGSYMHAVFELKAYEASEIGTSLPHTFTKYRIDYTQEWVMRLCNPRVCGYPEAKLRDKCKQVGYCA